MIRRTQILISRICLIVPALFCLSCGTGKLQISSQPDNADVYISSKSISTQKIGVTPLNLNELEISSTQEQYQITISKTGYENATTLVPATTLSRDVNISIKLQELASNKNKSSDEIQKVASQVAQVQNLIKTKDFLQAEKNLLMMISQNPNVATYHELLGNVYYLKKDTQSALASYKKANEMYPGNPDTMRMINKLQNFNVDLPLNQ
jgi:predicted negative regulator of RcsB-dependent stress response